MADIPPPADIVVYAPRLPAAKGDDAYSIVHLDQERLGSSTRLDDALKSVPGVSLFRRTSSLSANVTTQGLALRAIAPSGAGRALVTLDGVPLNDPFGNWVVWSQLQPEIASGADVVRGAGSGPYGAGALTGTVGILSKDIVRGFEADLSAGSRDFARAAARVDLTTERVGFRLAGVAQTFDGFIPVHEPERGAADERAGFKSYALSTRLAVEQGAWTTAVDLSHYDESRGAGLVGADSTAQGTNASLTAVRQPTEDSLGYRLQVWGKHSGFTNTSVAVAAGRVSTQPANDQFATPATGYGFNAALRDAQGNRSWEFGIDGRYFSGESRERFRNLGSGFTRNRVAGGKEMILGAYAEGTLEKGTHLFTGGVRVDRWSTFDAKRVETDIGTGALLTNGGGQDRSGVAVTGRLGWRKDFASHTFLRAAGYSGFRPPSLNELHRPFRVGNDITEANPALSLERLYGVEIGAGYDVESTQLSVTVFANRLFDPIANVTIGVGPATFPLAGFVPVGGSLRQRQNVGRIDAIGVEAEASQKIGEALAVRGAISFTHAEVDGGSVVPQLTGKRPAQAPVVTATAGVVFHPIDWVTFSSDLRFETPRFEDDLNLRRLPSSISVDASLDFALSDHVSVYFSAENLFDANIETGETGDGVRSFDAPRILKLGLHLR